MSYDPFDHIIIGEANECWPMTKSIDEQGYGRSQVGNRVWKTHRLVYLTCVGDFPDGHEIDHLCRNRACCNPNHLEAVPKGVNVLRGNGAAARHARKTECPKCGGPYTITKNGGGRFSRRCRKCQAKYQHEYRLTNQSQK